MTADPSAYSIEVAAVTDRGLSEKRPENEDSMLSDPAHRIFAVADGVGGAQAGEVASQTAIEVLQEAFANQHDGEDVEDLMEIAIQRANDSIYRMSREQPRFMNMATTIVALHLEDGRATVGHVGDSRLYRLAPDGRLTRETDDHSLVEEEMRAGRLTPEQAATHPNRNVISRALGAEAAVEVDMRSFDVERGTIFLLCSDGITRHVPDSELSTVLRNARTLDAACEELKRRCFERGAEDNLTAVVVRVGGEGDARPEAEFDEDQTLVSERHDLHTARTLPETPVSHLRRPFDAGASAVGVATQPASEAKARPGDGGPDAPQETSKPEQSTSNVRPSKNGGGRGALAIGALLLTIGAVALAFYVGMMFERKGMSSRVIPGAATPSPPPTAAATRPADAAFAETSGERFVRLRRAVDLSPASEATRMSTEANGQPLESNDPEFLYLYGRALLLSDRQPEAAAAFDRAIQRINENMTSANGELKIDARLAKIAAHLRAHNDAAAREAADALSEIVRAQPSATGGENVAASPTP